MSGGDGLEPTSGDKATPGLILSDPLLPDWRSRERRPALPPRSAFASQPRLKRHASLKENNPPKMGVLWLLGDPGSGVRAVMYLNGLSND